MAVAKGETKVYIFGVDALNFLHPQAGFQRTEPLPPDKAAQVLQEADVTGVMINDGKPTGYRFQTRAGKEFEVVFEKPTRLDYTLILEKVEKEVGGPATVVLK